MILSEFKISLAHGCLIRRRNKNNLKGFALVISCIAEGSNEVNLQVTLSIGTHIAIHYIASAYIKTLTNNHLALLSLVSVVKNPSKLVVALKFTVSLPLQTKI